MSKFIPKKNPIDYAPKERPSEPNISEISVDRLIDDGLLILFREMANLKILSTRGKLEAADSRDLRDTVKLLFELRDRENESLKSITDEELNAQAKAVLD